ncbi:MAG: hypothetical protein BWY88_01402 [Synergistetes bacterium ADurb.Bin520]|nr:MAG: hypothetical protein BWY88_01402 [Synergistetes bacterium ADurb.Bin520]
MMRFAPMMLLMPMVRARVGTCSGEEKNRALAWMVPSVSLTRWVYFSNLSSGSLKPMCPSRPRPRIWRSIPPAASIFRSYRAHSPSGSAAVPSGMWRRSGGTFTNLKRFSSMNQA